MLSPADKRKVGGSDVAAIMGLDPRRSAVGVYARIVHGAELPPTEATDRGDALEHGVISLYGQREGRRLKRKVALDLGRLGERLRCNLDALSFTGVYSPASPKRVVDAKTVSRFALAGWGEPGTAEVPDYVALQMHFYLGLGAEVGATQERVADVPCLLAGDYVLYRVEFDEEVYGTCRQAVDRFWCDHVVPSRPPPDVTLPADQELVRRIRREQGPAAVPFETLSAEGQTALRRHLRIERWQRSMEARGDRAKTDAQLALAGLGAGGVVGLPGDTRHKAVTWSTRKGQTVTDWEAVARGMTSGLHDFNDLVKHHTTTSEPTRTWRPVPLKEKS